MTNVVKHFTTDRGQFPLDAACNTPQRWGLVENMSGLLCPKCGEQIDLFKRGGGAALALEMGVPFLGQIPIDTEVVMTGDAGIPLCRDGPNSPAATAFSDIVRSILGGDVQQIPPVESHDERITLASSLYGH